MRRGSGSNDGEPSHLDLFLGRQNGTYRLQRLTKREKEVLACFSHGFTSAEVANILVISEKTVHNHVSNIHIKMGVGTTTAAYQVAFHAGLITNEDGIAMAARIIEQMRKR